MACEFFENKSHRCSSAVSEPSSIGPRSQQMLNKCWLSVCLTDWLTTRLVISKVTFTHWALPNVGHSLMTKYLHGINLFFLFPVGHLHSESRNSFSAYRNHSHGKLRLLLVERNNIKMYEISLMSMVMPAKGTVKFCETPPPSSTHPDSQTPLGSIYPFMDSCSRGSWHNYTH